jgi:hypothetical protein
MPHPFQATLDEYQVAIDHLVPPVPEEIKKEAKEAHDKLLADDQVLEREVQSALIKTGKAEYPYRKAYHELVGQKVEDRRLEIVLDHIEPEVKAKLEKHIKDGAPLDLIIKSDIFENEFTAEERHQVEDGILDAKDHVKEEMTAENLQDDPAYQKLTEKWTKMRDEINAQIEKLSALKEKDKEKKWSEEIDARVERFSEGFLVTERDAELEEVKKEIEYWIGTFGEEL